jgi:ATP-dependent Lon protease
VEVVKNDRKAQVQVNSKNLAKFLGPAKFRYSKAETEHKVGVATGLAWTDLGGELLNTEVTVMPGKGKLIITGKLGEVMQESARPPQLCVRGRELV